MKVLELPLPPLANRYWRLGRGHLYRSHDAEVYRQTVAVLGRDYPRHDGDVVVTVKVYRKRHAGDLDNYLKVLLDALQGVAFTNDRQVQTILASLEPVDPVRPRVEVIVSDAPC